MADLAEPRRLDALRAHQRVLEESDPRLDRAVATASRLLAAPVSLITFVEPERQEFRSAVGLDDGDLRETPIEYSFCQHVVRGEAPFVVGNARAEPLVQDNPAVEELHVAAYLGVPVHSREGEVLGSLCVVDHEPRGWDERDVAALSDLAVLVEDVLEQRRLAFEIERERTLLREVFDEAPALLARLHGSDHVCLFANSAARAAIDHRPLLRLTLGEALPELRAQGVLDRLDEVLDTGRALSGRAFQIQLLDRQGCSSTRYLDYVLQPLRGADDAVQGILMHGVDVTERVEAHRAHEETETRLRRFVEHLDDVVFRYALQPEPRLEYVNPAADRVLGDAPRALLERPELVWKRLHRDDRHLFRAASRNVLRGQMPATSTLRLRFRRAPDTFVWTEVRLLPVRRSDGTLIAIEGILRDISRIVQTQRELQRAKEEAERLALLKTGLLANMTHEVRTPLTSILGFTELLQDEVEEPHLCELVGYVHRSGRRLLRTLNHVLDMAQLEAGSMQLERRPLDLAEVVRDLLDVYQPEAVRAGLALRADMQIEPAHVLSDEGAVERVLSNLVSNALKFTREGEVRLTVRVATSDMLAVDVRDTGVGIGADFLLHVFEPFRQESVGDQRAFEGSGLGLAIARELAEAVGGSLHVESTKGEGSTFTLTLPRWHDAHIYSMKPSR